MFEMVENYTPSATIKVIGVGGGGGNAVSHMLSANLEGRGLGAAVREIRSVLDGSPPPPGFRHLKKKAWFHA